MTAPHTVLLLGGTGRTGGRVLQELLTRGVEVRAVVRSAGRLPAGVAGDPRLRVVEGDVLGLSDERLAELARGCDAVVSCLGHTISLAGVFGRPRDLVTRAARQVFGALQALRPERPVRFILMSSVSVNRPGAHDPRRGHLERAFLWVLRGLVPPARDNQRAADFLAGEVGTDDPYLQWVAVRPDSLREGEAAPYALHDGLVDSLLRPGSTTMAGVADFMARLVTDPGTWAEWRGRMPVVVTETAR